jgi:hypothetical protein
VDVTHELLRPNEKTSAGDHIDHDAVYNAPKLHLPDDFSLRLTVGAGQLIDGAGLELRAAISIFTGPEQDGLM